MSGALDPELLAEARRVQLRADRMVTDVMSGGYSSVFRGAGIEFDEVREFAEGDELRSVDWNVTARVGRPFVKKFVEERELTVLILLSCCLVLPRWAAAVDSIDFRHHVAPLLAS